MDRSDSTFCAALSVMLFIMLYKVILIFNSVDRRLQCDHLNRCYSTVLPYSAVCYAVRG